MSAQMWVLVILWMLIPFGLVVRRGQLRIWQRTGLRSYYFAVFLTLVGIPIAVLFAGGMTLMIIGSYDLLALCLWGTGILLGLVAWAIFLIRVIYYRWFCGVRDYAKLLRRLTPLAVHDRTRSGRVQESRFAVCCTEVVGSGDGHGSSIRRRCFLRCVLLSRRSDSRIRDGQHGDDLCCDGLAI